jgi:protein-tyrosine phosphatase
VKATLYEIGPVDSGRLAITPRPRGGDWLADELSALRDVGVGALVSLLTPAEEAELELSAEAELARAAGLTWLSLPIQDRTLPSDAAAFEALLSAIAAQLARGLCVAVHCRQSIGRASVVAASVLVRHGAAPDEAWRRIEAARGRPVPDTPEQRRFVEGLTRPA